VAGGWWQVTGEVGGPVVFFVAGQGRQVRERLVELRVEGVAQQRQEFVAEAVACEGSIAIGLVFAPGDAAFAKPGFDFGAVDFEERTNQALAGHRQDPREAGEPGPAQDAVEHGFGLVGTRVAGGYAVEGSRRDQIRIKSLPDLARGLFQVAIHGWNIGVAKMERKRDSGSQVRDEFGVRHRRRAANPVLDVNHAEAQIPQRIQVTCQLAQGMQQEDGIGASRYSDADALPGFGRREVKHVMSRDGLGYAVEHSSA
jgi:hypothetical protein